MTPRLLVVFDDRAIDELLRLQDEFREIGWRVEARFLAELDRIITLVETNPRIYPPVYRYVRRVVFRKYPFALFFRLEEGRTAQVLAVMHQKRSPRRWP